MKIQNLRLLLPISHKQTLEEKRVGQKGEYSFTADTTQKTKSKKQQQNKLLIIQNKLTNKSTKKIEFLINKFEATTKRM